MSILPPAGVLPVRVNTASVSPNFSGIVVPLFEGPPPIFSHAVSRPSGVFPPSLHDPSPPRTLNERLLQNAFPFPLGILLVKKLSVETVVTLVSVLPGKFPLHACLAPEVLAFSF